MENLNLSDQAIFFLADARKWARFLAIIGFIVIGLLIILAIIMALMFDALMQSIPNYPISGSAFALIYIVEAVILYFPVQYLNKFSIHSNRAILSGEETSLTEAFRYLRAHYRFVGIVTIIFLALGALSMIVGFFAAIFGALFI
jgi:hypothetical protein